MFMIDYFIDQSVKCWSVKCKLCYVTSTNLLSDLCHLFLDTDQVSSVSDKWNWLKENGIYKGQTLIRSGGSSTATLDPLLQMIMHDDFQEIFLTIM